MPQRGSLALLWRDTEIIRWTLWVYAYVLAEKTVRQENAWSGYAIRGEGHWPKNLLGFYSKWKGSSGTLKSWLTQAEGVGRTPWGERGLSGPTGLLILPGEDWSPPGKRPINSYKTKIWIMSERTRRRLYKITRIGEVTKNKKEAWRSLERAPSSAQLTEERKEEDWRMIGFISQASLSRFSKKWFCIAFHFYYLSIHARLVLSPELFSYACYHCAYIGYAFAAIVGFRLYLMQNAAFSMVHLSFLVPTYICTNYWFILNVDFHLNRRFCWSRTLVFSWSAF